MPSEGPRYYHDFARPGDVCARCGEEIAEGRVLWYEGAVSHADNSRCISALRARVARLEGALLEARDYTSPVGVRIIDAALAPDAARKEGV